MFETQPLFFFGGIGTVLAVVGLFLHGISGTFVFPFLLMIGAIPLFTLGLVISIIKRLKR